MGQKIRFANANTISRLLNFAIANLKHFVDLCKFIFINRTIYIHHFVNWPSRPELPMQIAQSKAVLYKTFPIICFIVGYACDKKPTINLATPGDKSTTAILDVSFLFSFILVDYIKCNQTLMRIFGVFVNREIGNLRFGNAV